MFTNKLTVESEATAEIAILGENEAAVKTFSTHVS